MSPDSRPDRRTGASPALPAGEAAEALQPDADAVDRAALQAAATGDRAAFEQLYRRYFPRLARFLRRFNDRSDLIEDVINKTMWAVWNQAAGFRGDSKVGTWITGIAYRSMLKALRDGAPHAEVAEPCADDETAEPNDGASAQSRQELRDWVDKGLRLLPEDLRTTMELAYLMGLSCAEIATVMHCAEGTVKARMFHARLRLRNLMPALGGLEPASTAAASGSTTG